MQCGKCKRDEPYPILRLLYIFTVIAFSYLPITVKFNTNQDPLTIRYRVELDIEEDGSHMQCVMFDKEVEKLINFTASELGRLMIEVIITLPCTRPYMMKFKNFKYLLQWFDKKQEDIERSIPSQLAQIVGKQYIFNLKLNDSNLSAYKENFTVSRVLLPSDIVDDERDKVKLIHMCLLRLALTLVLNFNSLQLPNFFFSYA